MAVRSLLHILLRPIPRPHHPNVSEPLGTMVHTGECAIKSELLSILDIGPKVYD